MDEEEILNKYIDLIDKGYCCACNELKNSSDPMQRVIGQELVKILTDYGLVRECYVKEK